MDKKSLSEADIISKFILPALKERIRESQTIQLHLADAMAEQALN